MTVIETKSVQKCYQVGSNSVHAVDGIDLAIDEGEFVCISGRSGSGKSTLLSLLAGLESPTDGEVILMGEHLETMNEKERGRFRRENIGFVFQAYNLLPQFNAWENVAVPLEIRGIPLQERRQMAMEALEMVGLSDHAEHRPAELSGGQQQRISIARAIITRPGIVFADEPTGNLDTKTTKEVMELMVRLCRKNNQTLVLVTHDRELALYADRIITLIDGKVVDDRENRSIAEISEEPSETTALPENTSASKALQSSQDDEMAQVVNALLPDDLQEQPKQLGEVVDEKPEEMEEKQEITDQEREDEEKQ